MSDQQTLAMLERRRIEAAILKHVYETLKASHGAETAKRAVAESVRRSALEQAGQFAAAEGGRTSMQTFIDRQELWTREDTIPDLVEVDFDERPGSGPRLQPMIVELKMKMVQ